MEEGVVPPLEPVPPLGPEARPEGEVPVAGAAVIQRWCLFLAAYNYDIQFRSSGERANCDDLSRLPCTEGPTSSGSAGQLDVFALSQIQGEPVEAKQVALRRSDEELHGSRLGIVKTKRLARSLFYYFDDCFMFDYRCLAAAYRHGASD